MTRTTRTDTSHLVAEKNPFGTHDQLSFSPHNLGTHLRCRHCNHLIDSAFAELGKCGWCNTSITRKMEWAEMFIEAVNTKAYHGAWNKAVLEEAHGLKQSGVIDMEMNARPLNDVDKNKVARHVALLRKQDELKKWNEHWRMQSPVSKALKGRK